MTDAQLPAIVPPESEPQRKLTLEFFCVQHPQPHSHLCGGRSGLAEYGGLLIKMPESGDCFCGNDCPIFRALADRNGTLVQ